MEQARLKLDESDLGGAIAAAIDTVKKNPTNVSARTFLFELSCFSGDWERAEKQLNSAAAPQISSVSDEALAEELRRRSEAKTS